MGSKNKAPKAPDYSGLIKAATDQSTRANDLSKEQFDWAKQQYADNKPILDNVITSAQARATASDKAAAEDRARYTNTFIPLQDQFIKTAQDYNSPERTDLEMGKAQANVAQNFDASRNASLQSLESYGIDPSSTRFAALDAQSRIQQAAAAAGAGNQARDTTAQTGLALQQAAIQMGQNLPGQSQAEYATGNQAGSVAGNTALAGTASGAQTMGTGTDWAGVGNQALNTTANAMNAGYSNTMQQYTANQNSSSGLGSLAGMALGAAAPGGGSVLSAMMGLADGGAIPATPGGNIPPSASPTGGQATDDVDAKLTVGEFVIPKDVMSWYGEKTMQGMIQKAREAKAQAVAKPKFAMAPAGIPAFVSRPGQASAIPAH